MPSVEDRIGKSFLVRTIEWGLDHPQGFSVSEVTEAQELSLSEEQKDILRTYLQIAHSNHYSISVARSGPVNPDTLFLTLYSYSNDNYQDERSKYVVGLESQFNFIDYQELRFARQNSREAKILSVVAIIISLLSIVISAFNTQDVKIVTLQFNELTDAIESTRVSNEQIRNILETLVQVKK